MSRDDHSSHGTVLRSDQAAFVIDPNGLVSLVLPDVELQCLPQLFFLQRLRCASMIRTGSMS